MLAFFRIRLGGMQRGTSLMKAASKLPPVKLFVPKLILEVPKIVHVESPVRLATITMHGGSVVLGRNGGLEVHALPGR